MLDHIYHKRSEHSYTVVVDYWIRQEPDQPIRADVDTAELLARVQVL